jgi:hypothetical protein
VVPEYNKRWFRGGPSADADGKYLGPSRDLISAKYKLYREAYPLRLKKPPRTP